MKTTLINKFLLLSAFLSGACVVRAQDESIATRVASIYEVLEDTQKELAATENNLELTRFWLLFALGFMAFLFVVYAVYVTRKHKNERKAYDAEIETLTTNLGKLDVLHDRNILYTELVQNKLKAIAAQHQSKEDFFVLEKPRGLVNGDFYYMRRFGDVSVLAVCDCTGYGVTAGLLSVLGLTLLNDYMTIMNENTTAADIIAFVRAGVEGAITNAKSNNDDVSMADIDMSVVVYREGAHELQLAGGSRPIYLVHQGVLTEYRSSRNPLSNYVEGKPFNTQHIEADKGDIVYLYTDGVVNQFSQLGEKFKSRRLKAAINRYHTLDMSKQREYYAQTFDDFTGNSEQIDDLLLVGKRL